MELWSRRKFFLTSLAGSAIAGATKLFGRTLSDSNGATATARAFPGSPAQGKRPLIISSANGLHALDKGMDILKKGGDTLDAVVAAVTVVEDDPNDDSVGYGGLPNEEGEVELDASVMHGPTHRAGSVASVRRIKNVARLAKTVMERTNHVMIVGDGARRYAVAQGFEEMNLLTEHSRKIWLAWKKLNGPADLSMPVKLPLTLPARFASVFSRGNVLGETIAWASPCISGRGRRIPANLFGALVATNEEPGKLLFVARKSGRAFAKTIELEGSMIAHEPKFLSENLIIFPKVGKGARYSFVFPRSNATLVEAIVQDLRVRISSPIWPVDLPHAGATDDASEEAHERAVSS